MTVLHRLARSPLVLLESALCRLSFGHRRARHWLRAGNSHCA